MSTSEEQEPNAEQIEEIERLRQEISALRDSLRRVQEELATVRLRESRFRTYLDESSDPIFVIDANGLYLHVNHAFAKGVDRSAEQIIGKRIWDVFPGPEGDHRFSAVKSALETGQIHNLEVKVEAAGETRFYLTTVRPLALQPDSPPMALCISKDITQRRLTEEALRESEVRFRYTFDKSPVCAAMLAPSSKFMRVNEALCQLLGYSAPELIGLRLRDVTHPDQRDQEKAVVQQLLAGEINRRQYETQFLRKDGSVVWAQVNVTLLRDAEGNPLYLLPLVEDITDKKRQAEEEARRAEQSRHSQKMESIGRLAGGIAHDFNNLLTGIIGNVSLAQLDLSPTDPLQATLADIDKAAGSAAALTRQLLAFSRKQIVVPKVIDLNALITLLQKMLVRLIGEDIHLQTRLQRQLPPVKVDPGLFEQVIVNLAVNARDAMPEGGKLTIQTREAQLDEDYCREHPEAQPGDYVLLSVADTGCGIPEEHKEHLFEPFYTPPQGNEATGLSLAMVYGAVKQAGGFIDVESRLGRGTTFLLYLPIAQQPAAPLPGPSLGSGLPGGTETLLLVEDEPLVKDLACRVLERLGYKVLSFLAPEEAIEGARVHDGPIHLLMTDVVMPGMNGRTMAEQIRAERPALKVLFTSGHSEEVIGHHGVLDPSLHFLGKPYTPQSLARKIREVIDSGT